MIRYFYVPGYLSERADEVSLWCETKSKRGRAPQLHYCVESREMVEADGGATRRARERRGWPRRAPRVRGRGGGRERRQRVVAGVPGSGDHDETAVAQVSAGALGGPRAHEGLGSSAAGDDLRRPLSLVEVAEEPTAVEEVLLPWDHIRLTAMSCQEGPTYSRFTPANMDFITPAEQCNTCGVLSPA